MWTSTIRKKWWYLIIYPYQPLSRMICRSKRGFHNINSNTHTSSFSYKVASQDALLQINVTLCQDVTLADNAKAAGCYIFFFLFYRRAFKVCLCPWNLSVISGTQIIFCHSSNVPLGFLLWINSPLILLLWHIVSL